MLKIKPQKLDSVNCFEGLIISYASWLNVNYELMFADSWGFEFNDNSLAKNITLGERINTDKSINWDYLNIYHGIKSEYHDNKTSEDIIEIIKKQLSAGYPTIIFMDNYWYPWSSTYKKSSNGRFHAIMVTGLDEQRDSLYCTDYMFSKYNEIMQISDFKNCGSTACLALSYNTPAREIIDWRLILRNFIITIKRGTGTFENMRRFSDEVITSLDIIKEMNGYSNNIWVSPLISSLIEIKNSRVNVSKMFKYIEEKESVKGFLEINKKMKQIEILWGAILGMVIKSYYSNQSKDINKRIAIKIRQAADEEEILIKIISIFLEDGSNGDLVNNIKHIEEPEFKRYEYIKYIELRCYFNIKCFGDASNNKQIADMSGVGYYLFIDECSKEELWEVKNMKFRISDVCIESNDSISCLGQIIEVPKERFHSVMLLGTSDFGSFSEEMYVEYEDNTEQKILIKFSDHGLENNIFKEIVAWTGKCGFLGKPQGASTSHIYGKTYFLQQDKIIKCLRLPNCSNIILYAISLARL